MPAVAHAPEPIVRRAAHASSIRSGHSHALTAAELAPVSRNLARLRPRTVPPEPEPTPFPVLPVALGVTAAVLILAAAVAWWLARRRRREKQQRRRSESASLKAPSVRAASRPRTVSVSSTSPPHAPIPHVLPAPATPRASLHSASSGSRVSVDVVVPLTAPAMPTATPGTPDNTTRQVPKRKASLKRHASMTGGGTTAGAPTTAADPQPQPQVTSTTPNSSCSSTVLTRSARSDLSSLLDDPIPMVALARFMVSNNDELAIAPGDKLLVYKICSDGWVLAVDEMGNEGFVPATCLVATAVLKRLAQSDAGRSGSPAALLDMARRMGIDAVSAGMAPAAESARSATPPVKSASAPALAPTHLAASFTQLSDSAPRPTTSLASPPLLPSSPILPSIAPRPLVSPVATRRTADQRARAGSTPTVPRAASISRSPSASRVSRSASARSSTGGRRSMAAAATDLPGGSLRAVVPQYRPSLHISEDDVLFEALHAIAHLERPLAPPQNPGVGRVG
ncbi:hypothetical protein GGF32_009145 [Allomyces javanicus]|nr:hypothetical protein GGF32_009145 [Allomyces javanicus]